MTIPSVQDREVGNLVSVLPELFVVDFSKLVTREMTIGVCCLSAAVGVGRGTVSGDWGSVVVSVGWVWISVCSKLALHKM